MDKAISILIILLFFISCKKEPEVLPSSCDEFLIPVTNSEIELNCSFNVTTIEEPQDYLFYYPIFNPLNPNELAFLSKKNEQGETWKLWRYNICNSNYKVLAENIYFSQIDWNPLNWILYPNNNDNRRIYKVKGNKTEGEQITNLNRGKVIKWNENGTKFVVKTNFDNLYLFDAEGQNLLEIQDLEIDQMDFKNNTLALGIYPDLKILDLETMEYTQLEYDNTSVMMSVHFFNEKYVLWNTAKIIAYTNIETLEKTIIKEAKYNETFNHLDISLDEQKIVLDKSDIFVINSCKVMTRRYLQLMDIDGSNERRINFQE